MGSKWTCFIKINEKNFINFFEMTSKVDKWYFCSFVINNEYNALYSFNELPYKMSDAYHTLFVKYHEDYLGILYDITQQASKIKNNDIIYNMISNIFHNFMVDVSGRKLFFPDKMYQEMKLIGKYLVDNKKIPQKKRKAPKTIRWKKIRFENGKRIQE